MWCDNCLLLFPLRGGGMVLGVFMAIYSIIGGYFMFKYGDFIYFRYSEWDLFGGLAMLVALASALSVLAMANNSYSLARVAKLFWFLMVILSGIRGIIMIVECNNNKWKIQYECDHGGHLYGADPVNYVNGTVPSFNTSVCSYGVPSFYCLLVALVIVDLVLQIYMCFLTWRFTKFLEQYGLMKTARTGGVYYA